MTPHQAFPTSPGLRPCTCLRPKTCQPQGCTGIPKTRWVLAVGGRTLMGSDPHQAFLNSPGRGEDMPRPPDRPRGRPGPDGHCAAGAPRPHPGPRPALQAVRGEDHRLPWCFGLVSPQCPPSPGFETRRCVGFRCGVSRRVFPPSWTGGVGPDPPPPGLISNPAPPPGIKSASLILMHRHLGP